MKYIKFLIKLVLCPVVHVYFLFKPFHIEVLSLEETLDELLNSNKSILRFGDGEIKIINGNDICFQKYDSELQKKLKEIIKAKEARLLIAIPDIFNNLKQQTFKSRVFWKIDLFIKRKEYSIFENSKWYNAFISRPYIDYKEKESKMAYFNKMKNLWNFKDIIFVEGKYTRNGVGNDLYGNAKSIKRIICPSVNAFAKSIDITNYIEKNISKDKLLLFSLGPAAKVIGYELFQKGYRVIDIGHLDSEYEWCLRGALNKIKIEGKHTAETVDVNLDNFKCEEYEKQVMVDFNEC